MSWKKCKGCLVLDLSLYCLVMLCLYSAILFIFVQSFKFTFILVHTFRFTFFFVQTFKDLIHFFSLSCISFFSKLSGLHSALGRWGRTRSAVECGRLPSLARCAPDHAAQHERSRWGCGVQDHCSKWQRRWLFHHPLGRRRTQRQICAKGRRNSLFGNFFGYCKNEKKLSCILM